jgi:transposase
LGHHGVLWIAALGYDPTMLSGTQALPEDPAELREVAEGLVSLVKSQALRIAKLEHQLAGLRRHRFGSTSETLDQLQLGLEEEEIAAAEADKAVPPADPTAVPKGVPRRKPLPADLPRHEDVLSPGETCGACGGRLKTLGEDVTEELDYVPGRFVVNRIVRPRLACTCCEAIRQAPLPSRPIERGRPGPGLLARVLVAKYGDHCVSRTHQERRRCGAVREMREGPSASAIRSWRQTAASCGRQERPW